MWFLGLNEGYMYAKSGRSDRDLKMSCEGQLNGAIDIRRKNPAFNPNISKLNIPKIFNQILGTTHNASTDVYTNSNVQQILLSVTAIEPLGLLFTQLVNTTPTITTSNFILSFSTTPATHTPPNTCKESFLKSFNFFH